MAAKQLGLDKNGIQLTMRQKDLWSYGVGVLGISVITGVIGQISYFYTDKVGMAAGLAGNALMITKIADAFTDLIMGQIVDNTKSKYGKARPWMLWMAIPAFLSVAALLCVPQGLSDTGKFIYAVVSNIFATAIVCTAISVPYACLLNYRTRSQVERTAMNIRRTICNYITGMIFSVAFVPVTKALGGTQAAWIKAGLVLAAIAMLGMFLCFKVVHEETDAEQGSASGTQQAVPFLKGLKLVFTNKYWVIMALAQLVANICYSLTGATNSYYARWIFGDESIMGIMGLVGFLPTLLGFFIVSPLVKKYGPTNVVKGALVLGVLGAIGRSLLPRNFWAVCIFGAMTGISTMPFMMVGMVLVANVADFEEWRSGNQIVGLTNSATSFGAKVGAGFGAGLIGWILEWGGYVGTAQVQTESAIRSIFAISIWLPGILILILLLLMMAYDMDKKYPDFRKELLARRSEKH